MISSKENRYMSMI